MYRTFLFYLFGPIFVQKLDWLIFLIYDLTVTWSALEGHAAGPSRRERAAYLERGPVGQTSLCFSEGGDQRNDVEDSHLIWLPAAHSFPVSPLCIRPQTPDGPPERGRLRARTSASVGNEA